MTDNRSFALQRFCAEQNAVCVHVLTVTSPFRAAQDRFVLLDHDYDATLLVCGNCPASANLCEGQMHLVPQDRLADFRRRLGLLAGVWQADYVAEGVFDGLTVAVEMADISRYYHVRMVAPPEDSLHGQLLAAWWDIFPAVRRRLR